MDWLVKNAQSRDVERQHLNKILQEIRSTIDTINGRLAAQATGDARTSQIVQTMVTGGRQVGINVTYNPTSKAIDYVVNDFTIQLVGDVTGTGLVQGLSNVSITTALSDSVRGIGEAPSDGFRYWRYLEAWERVPDSIINPEPLTPDDIPSPHVIYLVDENGEYLRDENGELFVPDELASATQVRMAHLPNATYSTLQESFDVMNSPGLVTGGLFTNLGSGNLGVAAGTVIIRDADDDVSTLQFADFDAAVLAIPADALTHYVGVERNGNYPQVILKSTNTWNMDTEFPLGTVTNLDGTLFPFYNPFKVGDPITNIIQRFDAQASMIRSAAGGILLANVATRTATLTSGIVWARLNDYSITAKNSGTQTLIGVRPNPSSLPPLVFDLGLTQWPNTQYLSGTTLTTMTNNRWANLWFFVNVGTNSWGFAYGTAEYNNAAQAAQEGIPSYLTENFLSNNLLVGRMIFEKNSNTPIVESAFTRAFSTQAVSDHNQLSNLQGGTLGEYYHLTAAQHTNLTGVGTLASGTYTPTLTNVTNVDSSIPSPAQWMRVGNTVTVSGRVDIDPTVGATTLTRVDMSLPVASNFTAATNLGGAGGTLQVPITTALLSADVTNDRAIFQFYSNGTSSIACLYTYTYTVI